MKGGPTRNRLAAVTVSLVGHTAAAAAVIGLGNAPPPVEPSPIPVELLLLDEPPVRGAVDRARPPSIDTAPPEGSGPEILRTGVHDGKPRALAAVPPPKPRRAVRLPRFKPPAPGTELPSSAEPPPPRVRPASDVATIAIDASPLAGPAVEIPRSPEGIPDGGANGTPDPADKSAKSAPPREPRVSERVRRPAAFRLLADELHPEAPVDAARRVATAVPSAKMPTGITRGVRLAAGNRPPGYPLAARRRGLEGRVLLRVEVNHMGAVTRATILKGSGHGLLDEAAREAMDEWQFLPAMVDGEAAPGAVDVPVSFRLR